MTQAARVFVLGVWTFFFVWLIASGEMFRYVGPRTYWVIWFGAVALGAAFVSQVMALKRPREHDDHHGSPAGLSMRQALSLGAILIPILLLAVVRTPSLGSAVAANKTSGGITSATAFTPATFSSSGKVSFSEIEYASRSNEYAGQIGLYDGFPVTLTGFVTHPGDGENGGFSLTRFSILCCAADVIPHSVGIAPESDIDYPDDTWLTVAGKLMRSPDGQWVVRPDAIKRVDEPEDPYL